jgi:tape measure domain-containing protein
MASKQVQDILIKLGIQGFEGLDKLKSSFRGLEKAIGPTDSAIQTARQSIIDFAGAGKQSIQSIQGQIDAFKGLQTQATIGGNVYRQLAGDVNRLSDTLKGLKNDYEEVGRAAKRTDAQIAAEGPARRPEAFRKQLAALKRQLDQLSVSAQTYGDKLTEITIKEIAFGRAQARQGVIAGAQAVGASLISNMQPQQQLPNTLAALQLRISELSQDFQNLDRAGQPYQDTLAEINRLQSELSRATEDGNADRKEEIRARIENYRQIAAENTALREQAAIRRSVERGRARAGAGAMATVQEPARRTSALFQSVAEIGLVGTRQQTELIGKSYSDVADTIQKLSAASNGSIQSLQAQRGAWQTLRGQVNPASNDFRRASKEIEQLDRRLGKLQQTRSRRMGGMQMAQAAGAAISGGIFGGPEGFLGGAIGGIAGGVGGAFVGAAAGAQVGMLRQQLGGFADYAAQIQKMEIALKNAAGSQDQFNQAVAAANSAVRNLNVPQDVAIQGMTRLTAAVKGAGGQVSDAELVFKNVTSAIKATGGSAEDVDGAITAMVQVFSKGKVSAEELSGQLGERLPGAVTKFAKANDMTLPELQKALEQGQVGLNELMNFIVQLGDEYSGVAQQIADSSQDAGARLTVAFNNMRIAVGEALQPIGAEFQEAFIPFH